MISPKRFDIFPSEILRRSRCVQFFLKTTTTAVPTNSFTILVDQEKCRNLMPDVSDVSDEREVGESKDGNFIKKMALRQSPSTAVLSD